MTDGPDTREVHWLTCHHAWAWWVEPTGLCSLGLTGDREERARYVGESFAGGGIFAHSISQH